jgi:hypothetical protein
MTAYILRRLLATIPVMVVVAIFVFFLLRLAPGDPAAIISGEDATAAQIAPSAPNSARPADPRAVRCLARRDAAGRFRHVDLLNLPVSRLIAQRVEPTCRSCSRRSSWRCSRRSDGRAGRMEGARTGRSAGDVVRRAGLRDAGVSRRLRAHLRLRGQTRLAAGSGLRRSAKGCGPGRKA